MKKITLFAFVAMLILLAGCKKQNNVENPKDEPVVANQIVEALDYAQMFYGKDSATVVTQLVNDGWTFAGNDSTIIYSKINDKNISQQFTLQCVDSVVDVVWLRLVDMNENSTLLDGNAFKECVSCVGESPTIAGMSMSFTCMMYYASGKAAKEDDFSEALEIFLEYEDNYVGMLWSVQYSRRSLLLSKYFDEELGKACVNISIG